MTPSNAGDLLFGVLWVARAKAEHHMFCEAMREVMIGMGERTTPQGVLWIARSLFRAESARWVLAVHLPRSRSLFSSHASIVFDQAENRLHTIKAVLVAAL